MINKSRVRNNYSSYSSFLQALQPVILYFYQGPSPEGNIQLCFNFFRGRPGCRLPGGSWSRAIRISRSKLALPPCLFHSFFFYFVNYTMSFMLHCCLISFLRIRSNLVFPIFVHIVLILAAFRGLALLVSARDSVLYVIISLRYPYILGFLICICTSWFAFLSVVMRTPT